MLSLRDIRITYPSRQTPVLEGFSLDASPGDCIAIVSPNGGGKTTLLNAISGVIPTHVEAEMQGTVTVNGTDITHLPLHDRLNYLAYQMADPDTQFFFPTTSQELSFAPENLGLPIAEIIYRTMDATDFFNLALFHSRDASTLSTGQKKLLLMAICHVIDAPVILLDEPSAGLSDKSYFTLFSWIFKLKNMGKVILIAEHNAKLIGQCDRVIELV